MRRPPRTELRRTDPDFRPTCPACSHLNDLRATSCEVCGAALELGETPAQRGRKHLCAGCGTPIHHAATQCRACYDDGRQSSVFEMGGTARGEYGCIVSFRNAAGERLTMHRYGPPIRGLAEACAIALARDASYLVVAVSTPETVYHDLRGRSEAHRNGGHPAERGMLSRAGYPGMWGGR